MFHASNAQFGPSLINQTAEEEEFYHRKRAQRPFREITNVTKREQQEQKIALHEQKEERPQEKINCEINEEKWGEEVQRDEVTTSDTAVDHCEGLLPAKRSNLIMQFDSDSEEEDQQQRVTQALPPHFEIKTQAKETTPPLLVQPNEIIQKKNKFLLTFSDEELDEQIQDEPQQIESSLKSEQDLNEPTHLSPDCHQNYNQQNQSCDIQQIILPSKKPNVILDVEDSSSEEETPYNCRRNTIISKVISQSNDKYYLQPIELGAVLQCVIKREKTESGIKYHLYQATTLRNFITVLKDEEGYLIISKYQRTLEHTRKPVNSEKVVARLTSNFFGTEFNCYLCEFPFRRGGYYPLDPIRQEQAITIEYQTNFFGMKGPRKMTAFLPHQVESIVNSKSLNQIYANEKKKKLAATVKKYKNKSPKWNKEISAYVLNFYGRATVSSIKNFIMIGQDDSQEENGKVLFGKFGKELFNLDIRHPFNLIQGISLALSSFDRKLACE